MRSSRLIPPSAPPRQVALRSHLRLGQPHLPLRFVSLRALQSRPRRLLAVILREVVLPIGKVPVEGYFADEGVEIHARPADLLEDGVAPLVLVVLLSGLALQLGNQLCCLLVGLIFGCEALVVLLEAGCECFVCLQFGLEVLVDVFESGEEEGGELLGEFVD